MIYTVRFRPNLEGGRQNPGEFATFATLDNAKAFIVSRPEDYGSDYIIEERSEDDPTYLVQIPVPGA